MTIHASKQLIIGCDHAGYALKIKIIPFLTGLGWQITDVGCPSEDSVDYPLVAETFAQTMKDQQSEWGIIICGSGIGVSIAVNRFPHIRAVLASDETTAKLSRRHNNANVLCLGGRMIAPELAQEIMTTWLNTPFDGGRHEKRVDQLGCLCS